MKLKYRFKQVSETEEQRGLTHIKKENIFRMTCHDKSYQVLPLLSIRSRRLKYQAAGSRKQIMPG